MSSALPTSLRDVLDRHHQAGVLSSSDVLVALTLARLGGDDRPEVGLAAAYASRAPRHGDVATDLRRLRDDLVTDSPEPHSVAALPWPDTQHWIDLVTSSPLATGRPPAVVVRGSLVFLHRYDDYEQRVARAVLQRARAAVSDPSVDLMVAPTLLRGDGADRQLEAVRAGCHLALSLIVGGPGTGKTTTVAALLAELVASRSSDAPPRVALAAPTGKAAARLGEALGAAANGLPDEARGIVADTPFSTLHRLLGWSTRGTPRHHRHHPLPHDIVIVDETSMVSLPLMARLLDAVRPDARLVLVGDAGQLASVDAGNVLGDLVAGGVAGPLAACLTELEVSRRFDADSPLDVLARAVRAGDTQGAIAALSSPAVGEDVRGRVTWIDRPGDDPEVLTLLTPTVDRALESCTDAARRGDAATALEALNRFRVLCAYRHGPHGVSHWNRWIESRLERAVVGRGPWYPGRPVMVTRNDPTLGVYNGDVGVVVVQEGAPRIAFTAVGGGQVRLLSPSRFDTVDTVHAMTIHKSQGSEFTHVVVVLPPTGSRLASRDLLYTAITRATHHVTVIGDRAALDSAVTRRSHRVGALAERLATIDQAAPGSGEVP